MKSLNHILFPPNRWVAIPWHYITNCLSNSTCFRILDASSRPMFRRTVSFKVLNNASEIKLSHLIWRRLQIMDVYLPDSFKNNWKAFYSSSKVSQDPLTPTFSRWKSKQCIESAVMVYKQFVHQIKCHIRPISDLSDDHCHEFKITSLHPFPRLVWSIQMLGVSAARQVS